MRGCSTRPSHSNRKGAQSHPGATNTTNKGLNTRPPQKLQTDLIVIPVSQFISISNEAPLVRSIAIIGPCAPSGHLLKAVLSVDNFLLQDSVATASLSAVPKDSAVRSSWRRKFVHPMAMQGAGAHFFHRGIEDAIDLGTRSIHEVSYVSYRVIPRVGLWSLVRLFLVTSKWGPVERTELRWD